MSGTIDGYINEMMNEKNCENVTASNDNSTIRNISEKRIRIENKEKIEKQEEKKQIKEKRKEEKQELKDRKRRKKESEKFERSKKRAIILLGLAAIFVGIVIILAAYIFDILYSELYSHNNSNVREGYRIAVNVLVCLGTTIGSFGLGSITFGFADFINYVKDQLIDVVLKHNFTDQLSDSEKLNLANKLQKEVVNARGVEGELYDFVQKEVLSLTQMVHYDHFFMSVSCSRDGEFIRKEIKKDYSLDCNMDKSFNIMENNALATAYMDDGIDMPMKNVSMSIAGKHSKSADNKVELVDSDFEPKVSMKKEGNVYSKYVEFSLKKNKLQQIERIKDDSEWNGIYSVQTRVETVVRDNDLTFTYRIFYPCKDTTFSFSFDPQHFEVREDVFVFKDTEINAISKNITILRTERSINVSIKDWLLPGDGIIFVLYPVSKKGNKTEIKRTPNKTNGKTSKTTSAVKRVNNSEKAKKGSINRNGANRK